MRTVVYPLSGLWHRPYSCKGSSIQPLRGPQYILGGGGGCRRLATPELAEHSVGCKLGQVNKIRFSCYSYKDWYNLFIIVLINGFWRDAETLIHLLKGSLGTGILAMPSAFANAGLFFGVGGTIFVGAVATYCVNILVTQQNTESLLHDLHICNKLLSV